MNACRRFAFCLLLAAISNRGAAAERDESATFAVQPGCTLQLDSYRGAVFVTESDAPEVRVSVHMEIGADTATEAERLRAALQLQMKAANNVVSIFARNPRESRIRWIWHEDQQIDLVYRVAVPRRCNVDVKVLNGGVTIGNLAGDMKARVENGTIFFRQIDGSVNAQVDNGDVVVSRCSGAFTARVLRGAIRAGTIGGPVDVRNRSGDIELMMAQNSVRALAEAGDVAIGFPRMFEGENTRVATSGGNILAKIDPAANCRIEASSIWGRVECKLPVAIEPGENGRRKLTANLNAGGPLVTLHASGGNVRIERGATPFVPVAPATERAD
ncbi:MAG TPA: hypothetical protein VHD62_17645 [Opitutaceae bacterium]|nr:hypothetical protein [Opitutaceae bacterium]